MEWINAAIPLKSHEELDKAVFYFLIYFEHLSIDLSTSEHGVRIGSYKFAYADDINLFSATVPGLRKMIDKCLVYSNTWRFKFGIKKT